MYIAVGREIALTRKNLMVDAAQVAELAARRGISESAAVREAVEMALFAEEFALAMEELRATGYGMDDPSDEVPGTVTSETPSDAPPGGDR